MSIKVWVAAKTLHCLEAGGHFWVYLNWVMGLRSLGCEIIWLEVVNPHTPSGKLRPLIQILKNRLKDYGLHNCVSLCSWSDVPLSPEVTGPCVDLAAAEDADILLNMAYGLPATVVEKFRRSALIDIDPGLTQVWIDAGQIKIAPHDLYFTTGETVDRQGSPIPNCGLEWHYTPPCVALDWWMVQQAAGGARYTTVSNWYMNEWVEDKNGWYINDKRSGFMPFLNLPRHTSEPLELALCMKAGDPDELVLSQHGWHVRSAWELTATPQDYQRYIQEARGEFSCAKPSCIRLQNAWISDRTLCFLASGKPSVVQYTGQSRFLPDAEGLFRFRNMAEALRSLEIIEADYDKQCRLARTLAETYFNAEHVASKVLEKAMG